MTTEDAIRVPPTAPTSPDDAAHATAADLERASRRRGDTALRRALATTASVLTSDTTPGRLERCRGQAQRPLTTVRRLVILGAAGGSGTSSLAVLVAQALQRTRGGGVALLGVGEDGHRDLAWYAGDGHGELVERVRPVETQLVDPPTLVPAPADSLAATAARVGRHHAVLVVDAGTDLEAALAVDPHALAVVARRTVRGRRAQDDLIARVQVRAPMVPVLGVLRDVPGAGSAARAHGIDARGTTVALPADRHVAGEGILSVGLLAECTATAVEELAGAMVEGAL